MKAGYNIPNVIFFMLDRSIEISLYIDINYFIKNKILKKNVKLLNGKLLRSLQFQSDSIQSGALHIEH